MSIDIPRWPQSTPRAAELMAQVLAGSQWGGFHPFIADFERRFAAYQESLFAIAAANGTVTLEAMLEALGIGPGDEVIVPPISFISTATAVSRMGATPVFADISRDSYNLDPECVAEAITSRTRAVIAVHFAGIMCDMPRLQQLCSKCGLLLLEDAAHAQGSEWQGRRAGSFGRAASFSFQNGKVLSSGEGGALVTSDKALAAQLRSLINCGRIEGHSFYEHTELGSNYRINAFAAAVLLDGLENLPSQIARRTANVKILKRELADCYDIVWQDIPDAATQCSWYLMVGRLRKGGRARRDAFVKDLQKSGIPCTPFYPHTLYQNPLYQSCGCRVMPCPEAEARVKDAFWLPHRVLLAEPETVVTVARALWETLGG